MRFRVLRSKAFWLGVPGLVFLLWAWMHSFSHTAMGGLRYPGGVAVGSGHVVMYAWKEAGAGVTWWEPVGEYGVLREGFDVVDWFRTDPNFEILVVPYTGVVGAYVLAWAGLLVWRARLYRQVLVAEGEA